MDHSPVKKVSDSFLDQIDTKLLAGVAGGVILTLGAMHLTKQPEKKKRSKSNYAIGQVKAYPRYMLAQQTLLE